MKKPFHYFQIHFIILYFTKKKKEKVKENDMVGLQHY
jgi:hypothetical protein